jgi:hypothetical protein
MATGVEANIMSALLDHLDTLVFSPALEIARPGIKYPADGPDGKELPKPPNYLRASFIPNRTETLSVGKGKQMHQGILQVSVYWKVGAGYVKPLDVADRIIRHFAKGTRLVFNDVKVKVDRKPWVSGPLQEPDRVQFPVTIPYRSFNA